MAPHRREAWLTSPSHPFVLLSYFGMIYLGTINLLDLQSAAAMVERHGQGVTDVWAGLRIIAGVFALAGAVGATIAMLRKLDPRISLWIECAGCAMIFGTQAFYEYNLVMKFGWLSTMETQGLAMIFALGGLARAIEIPTQIVKYWRAMKKNKTLGR